jgi:heat-inducible transcriptional repressor
MTLTDRRARLLSLIISEFVDSATPVGSDAMVRKHGLRISSATIRNEMAKLEEEGYISHPHTSAGRVPSDKGYRYYVEALMEQRDLPSATKETIRHQFHQAGREEDEWIHLAAAVLARAVENAAVVTMPRTREGRLKRLEIIGIQENAALLVVVLQKARVKQQILMFPESVEQDQLTAISNHLNEAFRGYSAPEIARSQVQLTQLEWHVANAVREIIASADSGYDTAYLEGVRNVLTKPEFASSDKVLNLLDVLEQRNLQKLIPFRDAAQQGVTVMIGGEHEDDAMRDYSVVISPYGKPDGIGGAMAVLGPTRMHYPETISTVRFVADLMGEMLSTYYDEEPRSDDNETASDA